MLAVLRSTQPMPLKQEPNRQEAYAGLLAKFGPVGTRAGDEEGEMLANLVAYCVSGMVEPRCATRRCLAHMSHIATPGLVRTRYVLPSCNFRVLSAS